MTTEAENIETTIIQGDFPFEEIRKPSGDYFDTIAEAQAAGFDLNQIWSVVCDEQYTIGPPHHWINLLGYIATNETHDNNTYYEEIIYDEDGELI